MKMSTILKRERHLQTQNKATWRSWAGLPEVARDMVQWAFINVAMTHPVEEYDIAISLAMSDEAG